MSPARVIFLQGSSGEGMLLSSANPNPHIVVLMSLSFIKASAAIGRYNWFWSFARGRVRMAKRVPAKLNCLPGFEPRSQAFCGVCGRVPLMHAV
jgi:hypothetical protein